MKRVYTFLADGFEEVEALTIVDLLRRAEVETKLVSVTGNETVTGAHGITVLADCKIEELTEAADAVFLPGGMPGTLGLKACKPLETLILEYAANPQKIVAAICAAPSILGELGLLEGKKATCYPGFEQKLRGAVVCKESVVCDGNVITSRGVGTAIEMALTMIAGLTGQKEKAETIGKSIMYYDV